MLISSKIIKKEGPKSWVPEVCAGGWAPEVAPPGGCPCRLPPGSGLFHFLVKQSLLNLILVFIREHPQ